MAGDSEGRRLSLGLCCNGWVCLGSALPAAASSPEDCLTPNLPHGEKQRLLCGLSEQEGLWWGFGAAVKLSEGSDSSRADVGRTCPA